MRDHKAHLSVTRGTSDSMRRAAHIRSQVIIDTFHNEYRQHLILIADGLLTAKDPQALELMDSYATAVMRLDDLLDKNKQRKASAQLDRSMKLHAKFKVALTSGAIRIAGGAA